jgi:hypothetical protein
LGEEPTSRSTSVVPVESKGRGSALDEMAEGGGEARGWWAKVVAPQSGLSGNADATGQLLERDSTIAGGTVSFLQNFKVERRGEKRSLLTCRAALSQNRVKEKRREEEEERRGEREGSRGWEEKRDEREREGEREVSRMKDIPWNLSVKGKNEERGGEKRRGRSDKEEETKGRVIPLLTAREREGEGEREGEIDNAGRRPRQSEPKKTHTYTEKRERERAVEREGARSEHGQRSRSSFITD